MCIQLTLPSASGLLDADRLQTQDMSSEDSRNRVGEKLKMMKSIVPKTVELPTLVRKDSPLYSNSAGLDILVLPMVHTTHGLAFVDY